ncbi:hypothetical protein EHQ81_11910 [Leptospira selangorensis]|uniref:DoxX family protein n=1 Tax=Leptospira selangorensis TaxID=2484982 RepID=A0A5F2C2Y0_9LEPT|nr:DUF6790 family protein [Leptospira selangorensis]TGM13531.1 hypothetical protein EHQ81_11910 [Leptospira selangorensis]TGM22128.1 hypothetical protein EHQ82_06815 [Leptospira selangorensis]
MMGYFIYIVATMFVVPLLSVTGEFFYRSSRIRFLDLSWKWFIFWAIGIRLISAGLNQVINPAFTASILQLNDSAHFVIRELGFANLLMGGLAGLSLFFPSLRSAATLGGLYLGLAGLLHVIRGIEHVNFKEATALISDLWGLLIVTGYYLDSLFHRNKAEK